MNNLYPEYNVEYICGCMNLRIPQKRSLKILDTILSEVELSKSIDLNSALKCVNDLFPICTNFERDFMSLAFSLATGVGKTRLMGAFITYLYTNRNIKNFFIVAPNLTIYNKLIRDFGDITYEKYVFRGLGCFNNPPNIITGEDYNQKSLHDLKIYSDINLYIFNISKFNSELSNIRSFHELLGQSYFDFLSNLPDLVILMDESHHYRAQAGFNAINDLKPVLGLELTATPQIQQGSRNILFKNVVYDYPLGKAVEDGYTKIPCALTRLDINKYNFAEDEMDKMMLFDGIKHHQIIKNKLKLYSIENNVNLVKPFALVICKDTNHAEKILDYIKSYAFFEGEYKRKVLLIHSNQKGSEKDENIKLLLEVEKVDNPIEIVIHINILKEGWDVNNLYTLVPLRTATSKTLREQTIGRGLRLPYGKLTGNADVDRLIITAHDKFEEIITEAQSSNSIFKVKNIIYAENEIKSSIIEIPSFQLEFENPNLEDFYQNNPDIQKNDDTDKKLIDCRVSINNYVKNKFNDILNGFVLREEAISDIANRVSEEKDLGEEDNDELMKHWIFGETKKEISNIETNTIPIPNIKITVNGDSNFRFKDFDLNLSEFSYAVTTNDVQIQSILNPKEYVIYKEQGLDFLVEDPFKALLEKLLSKPEIDYDRDYELLFKLISAVISHFKSNNYSLLEIKNIIMFKKIDIARKIYEQMLMHFENADQTILEEINNVTFEILKWNYEINDFKKRNIHELLEQASTIKEYLFEGFEKALHPFYKFDSVPEQKFAIICEKNEDVLKWFRPTKGQFNIEYYQGLKYIPDFVIETKNSYYIVEVKGEDKINGPDVIAKKNRAIKYCKIASSYCTANNMKSWSHIFIPAGEIFISSSIKDLIARFEVK